MARIVEAIGRVRAKKLSCIEAAGRLGISKRHFRRLRDGYEEGGCSDCGQAARPACVEQGL